MIDQPLTSLALPTDVLDKIARLGVNTVEGLRSMIEAAPADVARFLGAAEFQAARHALEDAPEGSRAHLFRPEEIVNGALLDLPSPLVETPIDLALRDRLFDELRALRQRGDTDHLSDRIQALEQRLNALLDDDIEVL